MRKRQSRSRTDQPVGTHAVALKAMERNAKNFAYPDSGFVVPVEHSLLYAMIGQPKVYPSSAVSEQILQEDFEQYLEANDESVSYAQFSALLVHTTENFKPVNDGPSEVSQLVCKRTLKVVVRYAEENGLDREDEIKDVLEPVRLYFEKAGDKLLVPLYAGLAGTMLTGNPIPYLIGFAAVVKGAEDNNAKINVINAEAARKTDVEKASLLDEADD